MTTACHPTPPWPTLLPGHIHTGHSPKAPRTMGGIWGLGSRRHLLYPHHLHPCHLSSSWGPETATARKTRLMRKKSFLSSLSFISYEILPLSQCLDCSSCTRTNKWHGCLSLTRNEWGPPNRKVDTRKYRAEPKSIFEYEPGKSSILEHERPVSIS